MSDSVSKINHELSSHIEKLLEAANSASQTVAALHVAFLAFVTYLGVIVWGTSHDDLLRISPVKLPILDVELPLTNFYSFVPWMVVLLHFNLLMQLELLSSKLWNLDLDLPDTPAGQQVRDRLFIFPFTHLIAGRSQVWLIRWLLSLVVGITIIALPLLM
ncbi:MAG: pentapeptide repeat-containing protein, partial [Methylobacter sp.]